MFKVQKEYRKCKSKGVKDKKWYTNIILKMCCCGNKKLKFIKEQEAKGLLNSLGFKTPLNKIPLLGGILF